GAWVGSADFLSGAIAPMKSGGDVFALPFVAESTLMVYRRDVFERAGLKAPETFDELLAAAPKIQTAEIKAYMGRGLGGFHRFWPNYLFACGGRFFDDPPRDMTPMLASAESVKSAEVFGRLYREFSVPGVQSYAEPQSSGGMMEGRAAVYIDALAWVGLAADPAKSKVKDRVGFALPPGGPAGRFPQAAVHGLQIPAGAKQKEVSWEFIKWATSKEVMGRISATGVYPPGPGGGRPGQSGVPPEVQLGRHGYRCSARRGAQAGGRRVHGVPDRARVSPHWRSREHRPVGDLHGPEARRPGDARRPA